MEKDNFFLVFVPFHSHSLSGLERCFMYVNGYQIQVPVSFLSDFTIGRSKDSTMIITEVYLLHILFYIRGTIPAVKLRSPSLALFILDFKFVDHHSNNTIMRRLRWNRKVCSVLVTVVCRLLLYFVLR